MIAWNALFLSLKIAFFSTSFNFFLALFLGFLLSRKQFFGKNLIDSILILPIVMPPTVLGYYLLVLFGKNGFIGEFLDKYLDISLIFTVQGAIIACMIVTFPLIYSSIKVAFEQQEPQFEQAAKTLGISNFNIFFRVIFPLAWKNILSGILLAFARAFGEFGATLMIAGNIPGKTQTLSIAIYDAVQIGETQLANTLVLISSGICLSILLFSKFFLQNKENK